MHCRGSPRSGGARIAEAVDALGRCLTALLGGQESVCCRPLAPLCVGEGGVIGPLRLGGGVHRLANREVDRVAHGGRTYRAGRA